MNRYSTVTIELEFEFDISGADDIWVSFEQGKKKITKKKSQKEITMEGRLAKILLTQEETGLFDAYSAIAIQARWRTADGATDSSTIEYFSLGDVLEDGVM